MRYKGGYPLWQDELSCITSWFASRLALPAGIKTGTRRRFLIALLESGRITPHPGCR